MHYKKRILYHVSSIVFTSLFLVLSTYYWFYSKDFSIYKEIRNENLLVSSDIVFHSLKQVRDENINDLNDYTFRIQNKDTKNQSIKISIVPDLLQNNISNNYVKYVINDGGIHSLNMDGVIYIDDILEEETREIHLKIWISETYAGNLNYKGRVVVS